MRITLIRHGFAGDESDDTDPDRELTDDARATIEALAKWMADNDEVPSAIYTSPMVRAQETADILAKELGLPKPKTDVSIGPHMSIRGLVQQLAADKSADDVAIVSHHESIQSGLKALSDDPKEPAHGDQTAMGELRRIRVKRNSGQWKQRLRVRPSDLGHLDHY